MMAKPPGVRVMASAIQKPPYEDKAVAPKVFPTAISLGSTRFSNNNNKNEQDILLNSFRYNTYYLYAKKSKQGKKKEIGKRMKRKRLD